MSVDQGNWFSNQKEVDGKIQSLDSSGNLTGDVTGTLTGEIVHSTTLIGAGAVPLTSSVVKCQGACTLADGTAEGQEITLYRETAKGNTAVITTATNINTGNNTITMGDVGDSITLIWTLVENASDNTPYWIVKSNNGAVLSTV